ncbi:MAG: bifunctional N(6)-L-threonylcarbamoyladenine synthase/serine/threonine protein kinase [Haloferacaceae archaeon]
MRVLGVEGTAWAASAAVYDAETDAVLMETDAYRPESGGIHPREAAEHMSDAVPTVVETVLERAVDTYGPDPVDAVAFSRGPGLGPCLRVVGTAARALAGARDLPLVGVNHMVAHLEIGRHRSGFASPVCLNASGANAHLLGYRDGRYRVLGETMDTGVGNALDKFARHVGWSHPGGPKVETAAADGEYVDLPYVVKGMDFSFSGIVSAAQEAYDEGTPVEDVCRGLQESVFAMLTEVSERALALTGADELVLGGGVGRNDRLREMLTTMCDARGADFYAPESRFLGDNAGMIAVLGAKMYAAGDTVAIGDSRVDPDFRPDEVPVTWRSGESVARATGTTAGLTGTGGEVRGAEALVRIEDHRVVKARQPKAYRHPALDERLRRERTRREARLTSGARREGVPTPVVLDVDVPGARLVFRYVGDRDLAAAPTPTRARTVGGHLAALHRAGIVHGDPTTRNVRIGGDGERVYLIDFGLGYHSGHVEDHAMDLHVFRGSLAGTVDDADPLLAAAREGYAGAAAGDGWNPDDVLDRLDEVEGRGRYR